MFHVNSRKTQEKFFIFFSIFLSFLSFFYIYKKENDFSYHFYFKKNGIKTPRDILIESPCRILSSCFPTGLYSDKNKCDKNFEKTMIYYDCGFIVKKHKTVGIISTQHVCFQKINLILIFNVCIDETVRGRGLAKKLFLRYIKELIKVYNLKEKGKKNLLGLDIKIDSSSFVEAFSLYSKLGFTKGAKLCKDVTTNSIDSLDKKGYSLLTENPSLFFKNNTDYKNICLYYLYEDENQQIPNRQFKNKELEEIAKRIKETFMKK